MEMKFTSPLGTAAICMLFAGKVEYVDPTQPSGEECLRFSTAPDALDWLFRGLADVSTGTTAGAIPAPDLLGSSAITFSVQAGVANNDTVEMPDTATIPFAEQALLVCTSLGLGKSDLSRVFGVSRPALYAWIHGDSEPQGRNADRLRTLSALAREICRDTKRPLYKRFVDSPLPGESISIKDLLLRKEWSLEELRHLLSQARQLTSERDARIARAKWPRDAETELGQPGASLSSNLTASGLEG